MLALATASSGQNSTFILIIIAAVIVAAFWRSILKVGIAVIVIGFVFLLVTSLLDVLHGLQALFR